MSFQVLPNLIFLFSLVGIIVLILRRVPQATGVNSLHALKSEEAPAPEEQLREKGVPAVTLSESRKVVNAAGKKVWKFMLEAKGLSHTATVNHRIKKFLHISRKKELPPAESIFMDEKYYIEQIKRFPKDWQQYNNLGQYYIEHHNYEDALGVYEYLTQQDPLNDAFWAKLGYVKMRKSDFTGAAESYEKSVGLDSSHPNRYYNLALADIETEKFSEAQDALKKALQLEPENQKYKDALDEVKNRSAIAQN